MEDLIEDDVASCVLDGFEQIQDLEEIRVFIFLRRQKRLLREALLHFLMHQKGLWDCDIFTDCVKGSKITVGMVTSKGKVDPLKQRAVPLLERSYGSCTWLMFHIPKFKNFILHQ